MEEKTCLSCKTRVVNDSGQVTFNCPSCSKYEIVRCHSCRVNAAPYSCPQCSFVGPN